MGEQSALLDKHVVEALLKENRTIYAREIYDVYSTRAPILLNQKLEEIKAEREREYNEINQSRN